VVGPVAGHRSVTVHGGDDHNLSRASALPFTGSSNLPLELALGGLLIGVGVGATRLGRARG
jgi:hypothetical protein